MSNDKSPVFQVRKVFDPKTMSVVEELVQTGEVESVAVEESKPAAPNADKAEKPAETKAKKSKLPGRKKNKTVK